MTDTFRYAGLLNTLQGVRSRYLKLRLVEVNGVISQESWLPPTFPESKNDKVHQIKDHERLRLDLLADKYYGDQYLWWVIALANDIIDPFLELNDKDTPISLRIPDPEVVNAKVLR